MASWIHAALWLFALWQDSLRSASNRCTQTILVRKASLKKKMMHWRLFEKRYKNLKISALSNWKIKRNRKLVRPFNVHTNRFVFLSNLVKDFQLNESLNEPLRFCNCQLEMSIRDVHSRCPLSIFVTLSAPKWLQSRQRPNRVSQLANQKHFVISFSVCPD